MRARRRADKASAEPPPAVRLAGIERIVVIAGPEASGKSTVIRGLMSGALADLGMQLGIDNADAWRLVCGQGRRLTGGCLTGRSALFHYNMIRPWQFSKDIPGFADDPLLESVRGMADKTFVTLWVEPAIIIGRWQGRLRSNRDSATRIQRLHAKRRILRRWLGGYPSPLRLYANAPALIRQYGRWIDFVAGCSPWAHWLLDVSGPTPRLLSVDDWRCLVAATVVAKPLQTMPVAECGADARLKGRATGPKPNRGPRVPDRP